MMTEKQEDKSPLDITGPSLLVGSSHKLEDVTIGLFGTPGELFAFETTFQEHRLSRFSGNVGGDLCKRLENAVIKSYERSCKHQIVGNAVPKFILCTSPCARSPHRELVCGFI